MNNIVIENKNLASQVMFQLDNDENLFTTEELSKITELVVDYNEEEESSFVFLEELNKFEKLESLTIRNGFIFNANFSILLKMENLRVIVFDTCTFENADLIASLSIKELSLINCEINNYNFIYVMKNLSSLIIINGIADINRLNQLEKLTYLQISYSQVLNEQDLKLNKLKELYVDNTNIEDFAFLKQLVNLEIISIDEMQYQKNKEVFNNLEKNNILVLNENMVEFFGDKDAV